MWSTWCLLYLLFISSWQIAIHIFSNKYDPLERSRKNKVKDKGSCSTVDTDVRRIEQVISLSAWEKAKKALYRDVLSSHSVLPINGPQRASWYHSDTSKPKGLWFLYSYLYFSHNIIIDSWFCVLVFTMFYRHFSC